MPDDHYVARTYLKHFAGSEGLLHAYRKSDGNHFPCRPADICLEPDGDIIPDFLSEPSYLGEFRKTFEPAWNHGIAALQKHAIGKDDKLNIAGYWANLLVCTPTWQRIGVEISNQRTLHILRARNALKPDLKLEDALDALDRGKIVIETEADYVRAQSARTLLNYAWGLYNADWDVFENNSDIEFLTSDNPACHDDTGAEWRAAYPPFLRYLPVTPRLCLACDLTRYPQIKDIEPDFQKEPIGTVRGGNIPRHAVEAINACVAKCAEGLVITSGESDYVGDLVARFAQWRVETESSRMPVGEKGFYIGSRTRVRERTDRE